MVVVIDPDQLREVWSDQRFTLVDLGVRFGCTAQTIANHASRLGLSKRKRGPRSGDFRPEVVAMPIGEPLEGGRWVPNGRGVMVWLSDGG